MSRLADSLDVLRLVVKDEINVPIALSAFRDKTKRLVGNGEGSGNTKCVTTDHNNEVECIGKAETR